MNETDLISNSERFLEALDQERFNIESISSLDGFIKNYYNLKENLDKLLDIKDSMESKGYKTPYFALTNHALSTPGEVIIEEAHELNRHNKYFRLKATAKKNIYDRIKSAIASHRIVIGILEEAITLECNNCHKIYSIHEFYDLNELRCACQSNDFKLKIDNVGFSRINIIPYLPISGNYMVLRSNLTSWGRESFNKIMKLLRQERKGVVKTVSLKIKIKQGDRWIRKNVTMDAENDVNYEEELRKKYGADVRLEFLQFQRTKPTIINDKHTRMALALGYSKYCEVEVSKSKEEILNSKLNDFEKLKIYDSLFLEAKSYQPPTWEDEEIIKETREILLNKYLNENNLTVGGELDPKIVEDIKLRLKIENEIFTEIPFILISWDLIKYYLTTSQDKRTLISGPFQYIRNTLDRHQVKGFKDFNKDSIIILKKYLNENIEVINDIRKILLKKFEIEQKMKGLNMKTHHAAFGAAILNLESGIDLDNCSKLFGVSVKSIEKEQSNIKNMGKPRTKKAKKFLDLIKK